MRMAGIRRKSPPSLQKKLEIPRAGIGLHQINGGVFAEIQAGELQAALEQAPHTQARAQRSDVSQRLDTRAGILVDRDSFEREAGLRQRPREQRQADADDLDSSPQPPLQSAFDSRTQHVGRQVGNHRGQDHECRHRPHQHPQQPPHTARSFRRRYASGSSTSVKMPASSTSTYSVRSTCA